MMFKKTLMAMALGGTVAATAQAGEVEVLHWWTSGGEARSIAVLKEMVQDAGHTWKDFAVAGGGGENAYTVLRSRAVSGNPPAAAQIKGLEIQEWGDLGFLASLEDVANENNWDQVLPEVVSDVMKHDGDYVAAPVNVHRVNWMWANPDVFENAGVEMPTTLDELWDAADQLKAAGVTPIAHGGQPWQDATTFESIVLAVGGADFFADVFVDHDAEALESDTMTQAFREFKKVKDYIDRGAPGRDWNVATSMVIRGEAAMQFMGDWAKGEFTAANMTPGEDYACLPFPGTQGEFTFNIDSLAMFKQRTASNSEAQMKMAELVLSPEFQETFNLNKGSIPARTDMDMSAFDSCALASMDTFKQTANSGEGLVPSMAHGMSTTSTVQGAIYDTVTEFFNSDMSAEDATTRLARAIRAAQ
ncbi:sugar ABC transporter substrate-binding protein [Saccharospirillum salsuginis]|uniref:Probable sugar-binding periplasmic protein n=2 Tax=Saccharospirillum salsuginis TaxID=418750 RepID=A0A918N673_9GAMM|nr:sugar ABC transporter substrate-binding protein [Saccharospirillum salsuginis]